MKTLELTRVGESRMDGGLYKDKDGNYYVDCYNEPKTEGVSELYILSPSKEPDGEPCYKIECHVKLLNPPSKQEIKMRNFRHEYMMLSMLYGDCQAYFGKTGNEDEDKWDCRYRSERNIWGKNITELIKEMKSLWQKFPDDLKPEWLTWQQILDYEKRLSD